MLIEFRKNSNNSSEVEFIFNSCLVIKYGPAKTEFEIKKTSNKVNIFFMLTPFLSKQRSHKDPVISIALIIQVHYSDFNKDK